MKLLYLNIIFSIVLFVTNIYSSQLDDFYCKNNQKELSELKTLKLKIIEKNCQYIRNKVADYYVLNDNKIIVLDDKQKSIYQYNQLEGKIDHLYVNADNTISFLSCSPDNNYVSFIVNKENNQKDNEASIIVLNLKTNSQIELKSYSIYEWDVNNPLLSYFSKSNNKLIATKYHATINTSSNIYVYPKESSEYYSSYISFSPDEKWLLMLEGGGGAYNGKLVSLDLNRINELKFEINSFPVKWIDDKGFLFREGGAGTYHWSFYNLEFDKKYELTNPSYNITRLTWKKSGIENCIEYVTSEDDILYYYVYDLKQLRIITRKCLYFEGEIPQIVGENLYFVVEDKLYKAELQKKLSHSTKNDTITISKVYEILLNMSEDEYIKDYFNKMKNHFK